jgi:signal transduction histidine kinase
MATIRLVIVEDDPLLNENMKLLLNGEAGITVVGAYRSAEEALTSFDKSFPDMVLADLGLPGMSGVEFIAEAKKRVPKLQILVHTVFEDTAKIRAAIMQGADGYVLKGSSPRELIQSVYSLHDGVSTISSRLLRKILHDRSEEEKKENLKLNSGDKEVLNTYKAIIAATSHSLKSELMHIRTSTVFLREFAESPEEKIKRYELIERSVQYSQLLLRRLLDFVDMGKPNAEQIDLAKLTQKITALVRPRLSSDIHLEVSFVHDVTCYAIKANYEQLMEVMVELLENARTALHIKGGTIELQVEKKDDEIAISVSDNGPGIPMELRNELFTKEVKSKHGLGLGLYLSSKIIDSLGGKLFLANTSEHGTTITLLMPAIIDKKE